MASSYSPLLRVELIGTGDQSGTWGLTTNDNLGTILEGAIAGTATVNVTSGNVTLSVVDGADDQARKMVLNVTGTPGTSRNIVAPKTSKVYVVINGSDSQVIVKGSDTTGVAIERGFVVAVAYNGTDFVKVGILGIPPNSAGAKTTSYTLQRSDTGGYVEIGSGGSVTIPNSVFFAGDAAVIVNNTAGAVTLTCSITTAYVAGTDVDRNSVSLTERGVATVLFLSGTLCVISGNVL
jgi:hypothetical protein